MDSQPHRTNQEGPGAPALVLPAEGCATTPSAKGLSDEELIARQIEEGIAAIKAQDEAAFLELVDESFYSNLVGDRDGLLIFLKGAGDAGFLDDIEIDISDAVIEVDGDDATMSPILAEGAFGYERLRFIGKKINGKWLMTGLETVY